MNAMLLYMLLVTDVSSNLYTDPAQGKCSEKGGVEGEESEGCGCGQLKRDSSQKTVLTDEEKKVPPQAQTKSTGGEMVLIPAGEFTMGSNEQFLPLDGEAPARPVTLPDFYIDKFEVTNSQFSEFVSETQHVTEAEVFGDSFVLDGLLSPGENAKVDNVVQAAPWWLPVKGATWNHPEGIDTDIAGRENYPVVHVSWNDAKAYCSWAGKRLPTEAEFEKSCQGGGEDLLYPWGHEEVPNGVHQANIWQGMFPDANTEEDGYKTTAPVGTYPGNGYQVHDLIGNVWEWVEDWWTIDNTGPQTEKVKKGGSFMCTKEYCYRFRCPARTKTSPDTTGLNVGFRCARSSSYL